MNYIWQISVNDRFFDGYLDQKGQKFAPNSSPFPAVKHLEIWLAASARAAAFSWVEARTE